MFGIFFRCEHDAGGLDYRIALFAFGKLQLLYRFHGGICFDGVVVAAADSHNGVDGAFFDLFDGALNLVANGDLCVVLLCIRVIELGKSGASIFILKRKGKPTIPNAP